MTDFFDEKNIFYIRIENSVGHLVLNRPEKYNAMTVAMWQSLPEYMMFLEKNSDVRVVVIESSNKKAFCAGADIIEMSEMSNDPDKRELNRVSIRRGQLAISHMSKPVIAKISGGCFGAGCGIALHCDFRLADTTSQFGIPPAKLGLIYPLRDTKKLINVVGASNAKKMLFTARKFSSAEALTMGLVDCICEEYVLDQEVRELAALLASVSQHSIKGMKKIVRRVLEGQNDDDAITSAMFVDAYLEDDYKEGSNAFLEKRPPKFY